MVATVDNRQSSIRHNRFDSTAVRFAANISADSAVAINSCTTINAPGPYLLLADFSSSSTCITIDTSNVDLKLTAIPLLVRAVVQMVQPVSR